MEDDWQDRVRRFGSDRARILHWSEYHCSPTGARQAREGVGEKCECQDDPVVYHVNPALGPYETDQGYKNVGAILQHVLKGFAQVSFNCVLVFTIITFQHHHLLSSCHQQSSMAAQPVVWSYGL